MASDDRYHGKLTCPSCGSNEFCPEDEPSAASPEQLDEVLFYGVSGPAETIGIPALCLGCGESLPSEDFPWNRARGFFKIGLVDAAEVVQKKYNKLLVRVSDSTEEGGEPEPVTIVTNDLKVKEGELVVVASVGARVPMCARVEDFGGGEEEDLAGEEVKKASVGGVASEGMLCDSGMLGWQGGAKGIAVRLDKDAGFGIGGKVPLTRPRK